MRYNYTSTDGREITVFDDENPKYPNCMTVGFQILPAEISIGDISHSHIYYIPKSQWDNIQTPARIRNSDTATSEIYFRSIAKAVV
jgi:hypothetical protein